MLTKVETELTCSQCDEETIHTMVYLNDEIYKITCQECGKSNSFYKRHPYQHYMLSTAKRLLREPAKWNREIQRQGASFLFSLPRRVLTKPYRMVSEFSEYLELQDED